MKELVILFLILFTLLEGSTSTRNPGSHENRGHGHKSPHLNQRGPHNKNNHKGGSSGRSSSESSESEETPDNGKECRIREYEKGKKVCVCDSNYCDTLPRPKRVDKSKFIIYTSSKEGWRFHKTIGLFQKFQQLNQENEIYINPAKTYQKVFGFGGSFTDSTGINILSLNEGARRKLMEAYFSEDGIEYNLCRVPIAGTDFSTRFYTYDDTKDPDPELQHWALQQEDYDYKISLIKKAKELRGDNPFRLFASNWAAPIWMKTNDKFYGYGLIQKEYFQVWADYFVKFLEAYKENGVDIWGITTQNEPIMAELQLIDLPSVAWSSTNLTIWVRDNLGPAIAKSNCPDTTLMILDDQISFLPNYTGAILSDKQAYQYISGIAMHWYYNQMYTCEPLEQSHSDFPDIFILSTEACNGFENSSGVDLGSWEHGENYTTDIIQKMNCWLTGWVDWNMVLNLQGGPSVIDNFVDSPIIVNKEGDEFYKQPMYYHLGHVAKFVLKDSLRIEWSGTLEENVLTIAYQRPDNGIVVVILNKNEKDVNVRIVHEAVGTAVLTIQKRSINTILYWCDKN